MGTQTMVKKQTWEMLGIHAQNLLRHYALERADKGRVEASGISHLTQHRLYPTGTGAVRIPSDGMQLVSPRYTLAAHTLSQIWRGPAPIRPTPTHSIQVIHELRRQPGRCCGNNLGRLHPISIIPRMRQGSPAASSGYSRPFRGGLKPRTEWDSGCCSRRRLLLLIIVTIAACCKPQLGGLRSLRCKSVRAH